jgi:hypothetical protein
MVFLHLNAAEDEQGINSKNVKQRKALTVRLYMFHLLVRRLQTAGTLA